MNIFETSERAKYERSFKGAANILESWKNAYSAAKNTELMIEDGFSATGKKDSTDVHAFAYQVQLSQGQLLTVEIEPSGQGQFFIDFSEDPNQNESQSKLLENGKFISVIKNIGKHTLIIQPEIDFHGSFQMKVYTQPSLYFPVAGKGNKDIQSFWGANRDGGARSHEGVDIFAKRGTPVVAAVDGRIFRTGNSGLGGKQVWLRDGLLGNSLYYAHLDSIIAKDGTSVKIGDTLGTVGNTGNAEGGAPHLHFGIYSVGGAVDPYPFIRKSAIPNAKKLTFNTRRSIKSGSNLRLGPGANYPLAVNLAEKTSANILAGTGEWYHVRTESGYEGFISNSRVE